MAPNIEDTHRSTWRRWSDDIPLIQALLLVAMAFAAFHFVRTLIEAIFGTDLTAPLELTVDNDKVATTIPDGATFNEVVARVGLDTGIGYRLLWWSVTDALAGAAVAFIELLRRIHRSIGDPFNRANITRLRSMSLLAIVFVVVGLARSFVAVLILDRHDFDQISTTLSLAPLAVVVVISILLQVWGRGIALQDDQELTV